MRIRRISALLTVIAVMLTGCSPKPQEPHLKLRDDLMGTFMSITAYGENAQEAVASAFERIEEIESAVLHESTYDTEVLMHLSYNALKITDGAFNHMLGSLIELWGIGTDDERVPAQEEIEAALADNSKINLGAIAKGFAAGEAAQVLVTHGIESALIELGGDIHVLGTKPDGSPWRIGLRSPLGDGAVIGSIELPGNMSMMTSGSYERYFEQDEIRYHHILDPVAGYPADSGLLSVTVLYDNPALADAYSTALFVMGLERGIEFAGADKGMSAIFITEELNVYLAGGLAQAFNLADNRFGIAS